MEKQQLTTIVTDQQRLLRGRRRYVPRDIEPQVKQHLESGFISVISGLRRTGKSTLLQHIRKQHASRYYLDFDDERLADFQLEDFQTLIEIFLELYGPSDYFFFDEIQNVKGWERFIRRLHNEGKKVLITGSNANLLSKELGTHLTGRYLQSTLYPFSFREFLRFFNVDITDTHSTQGKVQLIKQFKRYVKLGGLPEYLRTKNLDIIKLLYENILYRDVVARYNIDNEKPLRDLVRFCASNPGKEISFSKLAQHIGVKSGTTVKEYLTYLENVYLSFLVPRHSWSVKQQLLANKKIYMIDTNLIQQIGFHFSEEEGRLLENTVFIELKRRNLEIFYFRDKHECDFVIQTGNQISQAIQVTYSLTDENYEREVNGALEAMEKFNLNEGLILTLEQAKTITIDSKTIHVKPVWQWLLNN